MTAEFFANVVIGYLVGSVPVGLVVGYLWLGRDIRVSGSGKTGTTNVLRTAGRSAALTVLIADIGKGAIPALLGRLVFDDPGAAAAGAGAAIVGHVWPVIAGFRGGRGVATAFGGYLGLDPLVGLVFPLIGVMLLIPWRIMSVMSVFGTALAAFVAIGAWLADRGDGAYAVYAVFAATFILYTHLPNMRRLVRGLEPRLGHGGDRPATG